MVGNLKNLGKRGTVPTHSVLKVHLAVESGEEKRGPIGLYWLLVRGGKKSRRPNKSRFNVEEKRRSDSALREGKGIASLIRGGGGCGGGVGGGGGGGGLIPLFVGIWEKKGYFL